MNPTMRRGAVSVRNGMRLLGLQLFGSLGGACLHGDAGKMQSLVKCAGCGKKPGVKTNGHRNSWRLGLSRPALVVEVRGVRRSLQRTWWPTVRHG